jgi:hypothetical protein
VTNTFITPTVIARRALATLYNDAVLAALVYRDFDPDFTGKQGDTVNVRVPSSSRRTSSTATPASRSRTRPRTVPGHARQDRRRLVPGHLEEMLLEDRRLRHAAHQPAMEAINQKVDADLADELVTASQQVANPAGDYVEQADGRRHRRRQPGQHRAHQGARAGPDVLGRASCRRGTAPRSLAGGRRRRAGATWSSRPTRVATRTVSSRRRSAGSSASTPTSRRCSATTRPATAARRDGVAFHRDAIALATARSRSRSASRTPNGKTPSAPPSRPTRASACAWSTTTTSTTSRTSCRSTSCTAPAPCARRAPSSSTSARAQPREATQQ